MLYVSNYDKNAAHGCIYSQDPGHGDADSLLFTVSLLLTHNDIFPALSIPFLHLLQTWYMSRHHADAV